MPRRDELKPSFPELPTETIEAFADFIEYSDDLDTSLFRRMLARLQVSRARTQELELSFDSESGDTVILEINLEEYILNTASIYAAAAAAFDYARERTDTLPTELSWDRVRSALRNMKIWDHDIAELYATIERRETGGVAP